MDHEQIHQWEQAIDQAEQSLLDADLPDNVPAGAIVVHASRRWMRVNIVRGNTGGRWAYWMPWTIKDDGGHERVIQGPGQNPKFEAIADKVFNGDAAHFIGMLSVPYAKLPGGAGTLMWVLVEPKAVGPRTAHVPEEPLKERYERSKDIYNVETGKTERLP